MTDEQIIAAAGRPRSYIFKVDSPCGTGTDWTHDITGKPVLDTEGLYTADAILAAAKPLRDRIVELERREQYLELCVSEGEQQNAELTKQRDRLLVALEDVVKFWDSITTQDCLNDLHVKARVAIASVKDI